MIPDLQEGHLPEGIHLAKWSDVSQLFCWTPKRQTLCQQLSKLIAQARGCGFVAVYLFGSFISGKAEPGDIDLLWVYPEGTEETMKSPCSELSNYATMRERLKWDCFACSDRAQAAEELIKGFTFTKDRRPRGVIKINLQELDIVLI